VRHYPSPEKLWKTTIHGSGFGKTGFVRDYPNKGLVKPGRMGMTESKKRDGIDQKAFQKRINTLPGPATRGNEGEKGRAMFHIREELTKKDIDGLISQHISETTMSGNIGGFSMPFASQGDFDRKRDPAFGGRNLAPKRMQKNALRSLRSIR